MTTTTVRTPDGDFDIELPPGTTVHGSYALPPYNATLGDLWIDGEGRVLRYTLKATCPTCHRPGLPTWEVLPDGLKTYAV